jgi:hypothetical protein
LNGTDVPQSDETSAAASLRTKGYGSAQDVYQLWEGVDNGETGSVLYGVTLLHFSSAGAAHGWVSQLRDLLSETPYYGDPQPAQMPSALGEESVAFRYAAGGVGSPHHAVLIAVRIGSDVARVHLVPQGELGEVPLSAVIDLATAQASCLQSGGCDPTAVPSSVADLVAAASTPATPEVAATPAT